MQVRAPFSGPAGYIQVNDNPRREVMFVTWQAAL